MTIQHRWLSRIFIPLVLIVCLTLAGGWVWRSSAEITRQLPTNSSTITYTYDDAGRLIEAAYSGGQTTTYTYDNNGNILNRTDSVGFDVYIPIIMRP